MRPNRSKHVIWTVIAVVVATAAVACGSDGGSSGASGFQKITDAAQVFEISDFEDIGLKKSKQYDVTDLPEAVDAWLGFFGPAGSDRKDYELRFYPSHQSAVTAGAPLADEATGDLLRERKDTQTWADGSKERWRAGNVTAGSTGGVTAGPGPIHADFAIFGNVILLCEGGNSEQSFERCEHLIDALTEGSAA